MIAERLAAAAAPPTLDVLDVGCGTGNWLAMQHAAYGARRVRFRGVEPSQGMLAKARAKLADDVELRAGRAEELPWDAASFDYVVTTFALHHCEDKERALDEMRRVVRAGGALRLRNIDPTRMRGSWVYRFFPEVRFEDEKRFWSPELLVYELERRGLAASAVIEVRIDRTPLASVLADAIRRDISQLADLDDASHQRGIARIRDAAALEPEGAIVTEIALATVTATSKS